MQLKVGVIGLGIGMRHLEEYAAVPEVEITAAADMNPERLKAASEKYRAKPYTSAEEMFKSEKLDAVSICTPPRSHLQLTQMAAERKVHVMCEKPMSTSVNDAKKMVDTCGKHRVKLMIGFKKRLAPAYAFLKKKCDEDLGRPVWALVKFALGRVDMDWFWDEQDGCGPITENTVHVIDLLRYFMGDVKRVHAEGGNYFMRHRSPQIDTGIFTLSFKEGGMAGVGAGYGSEWAFAKEEVSFTTAKAVCEVKGNFDQPGNLQYIYRSQPDKVYTENFAKPDGFKEEIAHFIDCVINDKKPLASGEDGVESVKICLAVKRSIRENKIITL